MTPTLSDAFLARFTDGDERWHFELRVPTLCEPLPVDPPAAGSAPFARAAQFVGFADGWFEVEAYVGRVGQEVPGGDAAAIHLAAGGDAVLRQQDRPGPVGCDCDLITEASVGEGARYVRRVRVVKDGERLFRVDVTVPRSAAGLFVRAGAVVDSLRPLRPEGRPLAEPLARHYLTWPEEVTFDCPESWQVSAARAGAGTEAIELANVHDRACIGTVTVETHAGPDGPLPRAVRAFADGLKAAGVRLCGSPVVPAAPPPGFTAAASYAPAAAADGRPLAIGVLVLAHAGGTVLAAVSGPAKAASPWAFATNRRAFDIVRQSLRLGSSPVVPDVPAVFERPAPQVHTSGSRS